ncbi:MAG TPA: hypothetical protein PKD90_17710, partial [Phnomibacter sp.]|nr:hypothetical protein [Phnomibacter sp.]
MISRQILLMVALCGWITAGLSPAHSQAPLNRVEYYFNTDPGYGNGTSIPITQSTDISNQTAAVNINMLPDGIHNFYLRSRSTTGRWSLNVTQVFIKLSLPANNFINKAEYLFDTDP